MTDFNRHKVTQDKHRKKMAPITIEEENFLRIVQLIFGVVVNAVRTIFDNFFPPLKLQYTLQANKKDIKDLEKKHILRKPQMDDLFPSTGLPSSKNFDITLMMCLLKNLKQIPPHSVKMDLVPPFSDKSVGADLVRLRLHRNTIGHIKSNTIDMDTFTIMWADITQAALRLGGSKCQQKCDDIRNMIFDTTIVSKIQQEVQAFKSLFIDELSDTNQQVWEIKQQMDSQTTPDIHKVLIQKWEEDDRALVHTNAINNIMALIENETCILIKGNPGSGRSFTIRHVALQLRDRKYKQAYEIVLCRESNDIETNYKAEAYQVFVCDDICGEYTIDRREVYRWSTQLTRDYITNILNRGKSKLLVSVKNQVFQESLFSELNYLKFAVIDMSVVTLDQKCMIAKQLSSVNNEAHNALIDTFKNNGTLLNIEFAPLTFTLCKSNIKIPLFLTNPIETFSKELEALNNVEDKSKLCTLFFLIVHNGNINENYFSVSETLNERNQRESIFQEFGISRNIPKSSIEDHLRVFEGQLVVYERGIFRAKYQIYFDFLCSFFGNKMQKLFIKYAHCQVIRRKTAFDSFQLDAFPKFTILITSKNQQIYFERMVDDICHGNIWDTLENYQLHTSLSFRVRFITYLKVLPEDKKSDIVNSLDRTGPCRPVSTLYVAVYHEFVPIIKYLLQISSAQLHDSLDKFPPLIAACEIGHENIVKLLIDYKPDINQIDGFGRRPLIVAVQNDHPGIVEMLINKNVDINLGDKNGWTPFLWACVLHRNEVANLLMEHRADINQANNEGSTPLFWCSIMGFKTLVVLLHENGAAGSLSTPNSDGKTPLMAACYFRQQEVVTYLLEHLKFVDETDNEGWTPLMEACFGNDNGSWNRFSGQFKKGDGLWFPLLKCVSEMEKCCDDSVRYTSIIEPLLSKSDINHQDNDGKSALHHACKGQYNRIVNILTENGANVNLEDTNKSTAIMEACFMEDEDTVLPLMETPAGPCRPIIEQLLSKNANINLNDKDGRNPFCYSCETGNSNMVKRLIEFTNDVNMTYRNGKTPLQMAKKCGNNEIICLLEQKGAYQNILEIESYDNEFETMSSAESISDSSDAETESLTDAKKETGRLLLKACRNEENHMFTSLLEEAASEDILNISGNKGKTPLLIACSYKNTGKVKLLLEAGASVNKGDTNCWTPLLEACKVGEIEIVHLILENIVDVNKSDDRGYSPLFIASKNGFKDIVELLIGHRADVNIANNAGITPLLATCTKGNIDIVQLLIDRGANINQPDAYGNTSLMIAGFYGYHKIVELLLTANANIDQADSKGWTALTWATKGGHANTFVKMAYIYSLP